MLKIEFKKSASIYDMVYAKRNYKEEVNYLDVIIKKYGIKRKLLDIACGTGKHISLFCKKGYSVKGVDISPDMIKVAKKNYPNIRFICCPIEELNREIKGWYEVITCLFNALGYITPNEVLSIVLNQAYLTLDEKGLFIFDFRNGIPYLKEHSPITYNENIIGKYKASKLSFHKIDELKDLTTSDNIFCVKKGSKIVKEIREIHNIRHFFPLDLEYMLYKAGFKKVIMFPWLKFTPLQSNDFQVTCIAIK